MGKVGRRQVKELAKLKKIKNDTIDLSDLRELKDWSSAVVGRFYRPIKKPLSLRLDADVLAWLKGQGKGYQTRINSLLREAMGGHGRR